MRGSPTTQLEAQNYLPNFEGWAFCSLLREREKLLWLLIQSIWIRSALGHPLEQPVLMSLWVRCPSTTVLMFSDMVFPMIMSLWTLRGCLVFPSCRPWIPDQHWYNWFTKCYREREREELAFILFVYLKFDGKNVISTLNGIMILWYYALVCENVAERT